MKKINLQKITSKVQEVKAMCCEPVSCVEPCDVEALECGIKCLYDELKYVYNYIYRLEEELYKHKNDGHVPKIPSTTAMKKVIDILGLSDEYKVEPKVIYSSNGTIKSRELVIKETK